MSSGYKLLVVDEATGSVRELNVGSRTVWGALGGLGAFGLLAFAAGALATSLMGAVPSPAPEPKTKVSLRAGVESVQKHALARLNSVAEPPSHGPCASGMVLVEGDYCPVVRQRCLRFVDPEGSALASQRCAEFESPMRCLSPQRETKRYCIDADEFTDAGGELPKTQLTAGEARALCEAAGKRLCTESEWTFACEGSNLLPYPYGFERDAHRCNTDKTDLVTAEGELKDLRAAAGSHGRCTSEFGVRDLVGNVEEFVVSDTEPSAVLRKGAYWQPAANSCRTSRPHPEPDYLGIELGFRCCADPGEREREPAG